MSVVETVLVLMVWYSALVCGYDDQEVNQEIGEILSVVDKYLPDRRSSQVYGVKNSMTPFYFPQPTSSPESQESMYKVKEEDGYIQSRRVSKPYPIFQPVPYNSNIKPISYRGNAPLPPPQYPIPAQTSLPLPPAIPLQKPYSVPLPVLPFVIGKNFQYNVDKPYLMELTKPYALVVPRSLSYPGEEDYRMVIPFPVIVKHKKPFYDHDMEYRNSGEKIYIGNRNSGEDKSYDFSEEQELRNRPRHEPEPPRYYDNTTSYQNIRHVPHPQEIVPNYSNSDHSRTSGTAKAVQYENYDDSTPKGKEYTEQDYEDSVDQSSPRVNHQTYGGVRHVTYHTDDYLGKIYEEMYYSIPKSSDAEERSPRTDVPQASHSVENQDIQTSHYNEDPNKRSLPQPNSQEITPPLENQNQQYYSQEASARSVPRPDSRELSRNLNDEMPDENRDPNLRSPPRSQSGESPNTFNMQHERTPYQDPNISTRPTTTPHRNLNNQDSGISYHNQDPHIRTRPTTTPHRNLNNQDSGISYHNQHPNIRTRPRTPHRNLNNQDSGIAYHNQDPNVLPSQNPQSRETPRNSQDAPTPDHNQHSNLRSHPKTEQREPERNKENQNVRTTKGNTPKQQFRSNKQDPIRSSEKKSLQSQFYDDIDPRSQTELKHADFFAKFFNEDSDIASVPTDTAARTHINKEFTPGRNLPRQKPQQLKQSKARPSSRYEMEIVHQPSARNTTQIQDYREFVPRNVETPVATSYLRMYQRMPTDYGVQKRSATNYNTTLSKTINFWRPETL